jgi:hypothetical protein
MLVTVGIGLLLVGIGVSGYVGFNDRQKVINSARELETVFQTAQVKSQAGDLGNCTELSEYQVTFNTTVDPIIVTLTPSCADGSSGTKKTYELGKGVTLSFNPAVSIIHFQVLQHGVSFTPAATQLSFTFTSSATNQNYTFTLAQGGDISDGSWQ